MTVVCATSSVGLHARDISSFRICGQSTGFIEWCILYQQQAKGTNSRCIRGYFSIYVVLQADVLKPRKKRTETERDAEKDGRTGAERGSIHFFVNKDSLPSVVHRDRKNLERVGLSAKSSSLCSPSSTFPPSPSFSYPSSFSHPSSSSCILLLFLLLLLLPLLILNRICSPEIDPSPLWMHCLLLSGFYHEKAIIDLWRKQLCNNRMENKFSRSYVDLPRLKYLLHIIIPTSIRVCRCLYVSQWQYVLCLLWLRWVYWYNEQQHQARGTLKLLLGQCVRQQRLTSRRRALMRIPFTETLAAV